MRMARVAGTAGLLLAAACGQKGETGASLGNPAEAATRAAGPARSAAATKWNQMVVATPEGGVRVGNPDAKVKFLEFASLTCPHCKDFSRESKDALAGYVASGKVSYEFRPFVLNGQDAAISVALRCLPAPAFFRSVEQLYATQDQWIQNYVKLSPEQGKAIQALPRDRQLLAIADAGGMADFFKLRGLTRAKYEACLRDEGGVAKLQAIANEAVSKYKLQGTPAFAINGEARSDLKVWKDVDAALRGMTS